jgi:phage-related protein
MTQVISTIRSIWNEDEIKTIDAVLTAIQNAIKSKVDSAWTWGRDMMQNLINGIRYMYNAVVGEIMNVASAISEYLHFSVPDKGPLSKFEAWMPDFMKGLADGISKSKKYVEKAVSGVADAMQMTLESGMTIDMDGVSGAMVRGSKTESVINNYTNYNNQTFSQTNNSPKALNRYEIYRQTRNLIHTVKGR